MTHSKMLSFEEFTDRDFFPEVVTYRDFPRYHNFPGIWSLRHKRDDQGQYVRRFMEEHPGLDAWLLDLFGKKPIKKDYPEGFERLLYMAYVTMRQYGASDDELGIAQEYR
jgi:hypothetical protein